MEAKAGKPKSAAPKKSAKAAKPIDFTRPIFQLTSGRSGYTILSHSTGPDWAAPENYVDEVPKEYAPLFAAAPLLLKSCRSLLRIADAHNDLVYGTRGPANGSRDWKQQVEAREVIARLVKAKTGKRARRTTKATT